MATTMRSFGFVTVGVSLLTAALMGCGGSAPQASYAPSNEAKAAPPPQANGDMSRGMSPREPGGAAQEMAGQPTGPMAPSKAPAPETRPGLATEWGETRFSKITTVPFVRADPTTPFGMGTLYYNDEAGAKAMANSAGFRRVSGGITNLAGGAVTVGLKDERGVFYSGFVAGDRNYVIGESGKRYSIVLRNATASRIEVVVSVDGLDVLDGKAAGFTKRGYLLDPRSEVEVDGFRTSMEAVAAFRFGSVKDSYAAKKTGDTRNVGVIGVALFHERGAGIPVVVNPNEVNQRHNANPFPGQFATPP
jgi:hypothetical protein